MLTPANLSHIFINPGTQKQTLSDGIEPPGWQKQGRLSAGNGSVIQFPEVHLKHHF